MPQTRGFKLTLLGAIAATLVIGATAPPNSQPNPYRTIANWLQLPGGQDHGFVERGGSGQ